MRGLLDAIELANLIKGVDAGGETTVQAEHLAFDDSCQGQVIKKLSELFPYIGVAVLSQALIIETISVVTIIKSRIINLIMMLNTWASDVLYRQKKQYKNCFFCSILFLACRKCLFCLLSIGLEFKFVLTKLFC